MSYVSEPFDELDVMNYFMFNKLTTLPETSENFCRCLLRNLLGKEIDKITIHAEKIEYPDDPDKRGVRLDVQVTEMMDSGCIASIYDIEPHRDRESDYPRKNRFTQAQIDKHNLQSGDNNFSHLPDLYIICITNYDPFGLNRTLYTIKKKCVEAPDLPYDDGVTILYFNTKGTVGGSESLRQFLSYLEESKSDNVTDEATQELSSYVDIIKHNYEIGGTYMTLNDLINKWAEEDRETIEKQNATIAELNAEITEKDILINELKKKLDSRSNQ